MMGFFIVQLKLH